MRSISKSAGFLIASALAAASVTSSAHAQDVYALTVQGLLVRFNAATPGTVTTIGPITGTSGTVADWRGIDFRPTTSQLYLFQAAQGVNPDRLYIVNTFTGAATLAVAASSAISGNPVGMDFNPVADRLRIVTSSTNNYNVNPDTGVVTTDPVATISGSGNAPFITGSAYTNAVFGQLAATTTLYNIDSRNNTLTTQNPPANGVNTVVGNTGLNLSASATDVGFDIYFTGTQNIGYLSANPAAAGSSTFYTVNLATGAATSVGTIGGGVVIRDIAVIPAPGAMALLAGGLGVIVARRRR